nr:PstS family phosphate ABC transporter substrate-binding protein [Nitrospirota bacterium]
MGIRVWVLAGAFLLFCASAGLTGLIGSQARAEDRPLQSPALKPYVKVDGVSGTLTSVGSGSLNKLMTLWAEGFRRYYPGAQIQVENKGASASTIALLDGTAHITPMSRMMEESELAQFQAKLGYRPTAYAVAVDALVLYVHKENPIQGLTMEQVEEVFAKSPRYRIAPITKWDELDLVDRWAGAPINLYGLPHTTATHEFLRTHIMHDGEFKPGINEEPSSQSVVQKVSADPYALGYGGSESVAPGVRVVPLAESEFSPYVEPTAQNIANRRYPLRRYLYIYINQTPRKILKGAKPLPPVMREFLRYAFSQEGQAEVTKSGYSPVEDWIVEKALAKIK